jgi:signal transduction histidine kinase
MSWITVIWSMIAAASLTLGFVHVLVWWQNREKRERLWFFFMTVGTACLALCELAMMKAYTPAAFGTALRWLHLPTWLIFVSVVGFILVYLRTGRYWLAVAVIGLRTVTLGLNFLLDPNINYREITGLREVRYLGDSAAMAIGRPNPMMLVAQVALLLLLIFVVDASVQAWRQGEKRRVMLTGGSISFFVAMGTLSAILSLWQVVEVPVSASLFFMGMILLMAFDLSLETKRAAILEVELRDTQESKYKEVTHLGRVAALGELSVSLAHEMNQPLAIILSNAQAAQKLLENKTPDLAEVGEILGEIVNENLRASETIKCIRALLQRGEVSSQILDLNEVVAEVSHLMKNEMARRQVSLSHDLARPLPRISADRIQLQQVLLNLMLNACDSMATGGSDTKNLHVTTKSDGTSVSMEVTDNGQGLPADVESIFQAFFTTKDQGLGMGLAICRSIIAAHQGQLWAEPGRTGSGATFHVVLPLKEVRS